MDGKTYRRPQSIYLLNPGPFPDQYFSWETGPLSPDVQTVDIVLSPDEQAATRTRLNREWWGQAVDFRNLPFTKVIGHEPRRMPTTAPVTRPVEH